MYKTNKYKTGSKYACLKLEFQNCIKMGPKYGLGPKLDISWGVADREQQGGVGWRPASRTIRWKARQRERPEH